MNNLPSTTEMRQAVRDRDVDCMFLSWLRSPLGQLVAGATAEGVCLLEFADRDLLEAELAAVGRVFDVPLVEGSNDHLARLQVELAGYFEGSVHRFTVPLVYPGTPFQRRVWQQLLAIPYGQRRTYEQIALAVGKPRAARAVGQANGLNRMAILIPCHRLVNKNGQLAGYGGGLWRKQFLLDLEGATA